MKESQLVTALTGWGKKLCHCVCRVKIKNWVILHRFSKERALWTAQPQKQAIRQDPSSRLLDEDLLRQCIFYYGIRDADLLQGLFAFSNSSVEIKLQHWSYAMKIFNEPRFECILAQPIPWTCHYNSTRTVTCGCRSSDVLWAGCWQGVGSYSNQSLAWLWLEYVYSP